MTVGKNIKLFRVHAGLKQKELAEKVGIKVQYLSAIENEKKEPSLSLLRKIALSLNIPISMFFWEYTEDIEDKDVAGKLKKLLIELALSGKSNEKSKTSGS